MPRPLLFVEPVGSFSGSATVGYAPAVAGGGAAVTAGFSPLMALSAGDSLSLSLSGFGGDSLSFDLSGPDRALFTSSPPGLFSFVAWDPPAETLHFTVNASYVASPALPAGGPALAAGAR